MNLNRGDLVLILSDASLEFVNTRRKKDVNVGSLRTESPSTGLFLEEISGAFGPEALVFRYGCEVKINPNKIKKME
tara:strand:+ start:582 stop:809 length:228 start_codon:yes stop_codon:yes gene_type:complete